MSSTFLRRTLVAGTIVCVALSGCGGSGGGESGGGTESTTTAGRADDTSGGDAPGHTLSADGETNAIITSLESTFKAQSVEVDGDTWHVQLPDKTVVAGLTACLSISRVVPDGADVVVHQGGEEFTCE